MKLTEFGGVMDDAISRLREKAQNEATCFALNDECKHLRQQLAECQRERDEYARDVLRLIETIKYMRGIAERGTGNECPSDTTVEKFVLGYVKQLEEKLATVTKQRDELANALEEINKAAKYNQSTWGKWIKDMCEKHLEKLGADKTGEGS